MGPFFKLVDYEACEYNFITLYMWQTVYDFHFATTDNFMAVFGVKEGELFAIQPYCRAEHFEEAMIFIESFFKKVDQKLEFKAVTEEVLAKMEALYPGRFRWETNRDDSDYIYEAEKLRTLAGRKMHSKKNHLNAFIKEYGERFVYKRLDKNDFSDCIRLSEKWAFSREKDQNLIGESLAIKKVLKNYSKFSKLKVGGIYIDNQLEAFTFGDHLNPNMALIHIEKANPDIRGLYTAINKFFVEKEFPDVEFVNREDDLGIEGLRLAKLSYKPTKLVDKYSVLEE
ncbi:MAG: phosphatidylglycerol lysyltransferase domain-containing protein [Peptostreptococcaceae bacterium]|nr:phosphatidylglycerol lysyltransferase domain-containing protein [Peptostreptococcaceae bacterium]